MKFHDLKPTDGAKHRKKRVGRGIGSGHGKTSTKGHKGQGARSGGTKPLGFEGGQTPLFLRIPKRGFTPLDDIEVLVINISRLEDYSFPENKVTIENLLDLNVIKAPKSKKFTVKILGNGEPSKPYVIDGISMSRTVEEKILKAGGAIV
ncbi:MAG: 50S ribosomal protein L15 [Nitrospiraceae bacterium]|jgi:large subunit ribosomal protein L15|nr:50S ribosomal protein L15 [Nitrospiraceae bacterium]